jgi:hypothetical protein
MLENFDENDWGLLLSRIKDKSCTPFIGAGACAGRLPLGSEIAQEWARNYEFMRKYSGDLPRVAQFRAINDLDDMVSKQEIAGRFGISAPDFAPDDLHAVLADLPLPVYITTNYDDFLFQALARNELRKPEREICLWNSYLRQYSTSVFTRDNFRASPATPVVFHLHGYAGDPHSLVLTEDDYLDFLVQTSRDPDLIPKRIQQALAGTSLLFLGYRMADWDFRVLFWTLVNSMEKNLKHLHISVQVADSEGEQKYLERYFGRLNVRVYWGDVRVFARELRRRWGRTGPSAPPPTPVPPPTLPPRI